MTEVGVCMCAIGEGLVAKGRGDREDGLCGAAKMCEDALVRGDGAGEGEDLEVRVDMWT